MVNLTSYASKHLGGDRGIVEVSGVYVAVYSEAAELPPSCEKLSTAMIDGRALPVAFDAAGKRFHDFKGTIDGMTKHSFDDWPITGPVTIIWLLKYMWANGGSTTAFHHRWLDSVRLDYSAHGTTEHQLLCKVLEVMITYDGLALGMIAAVELVALKIQMLHEKWRHKMPLLANGVGGGKDAKGSLADYDSFLILGTSETRGNVGVCPDLTKWLGKELAKEALAAKERREAREERALAAGANS